ncbi:MAG: T9SS type A sorting domain-containing protein [Bacteroidota bacterium]
MGALKLAYTENYTPLKVAYRKTFGEQKPVQEFISTGATTAAINVSPNNTRDYTVTATSNGCSGSVVATVTVNTTPTPTITGNTTICSGANTTLTATGGGIYSWNTGATTAAIIVAPNNTRGYTVTATSNGCSGSVATTVNVNTTPIPAITGNTTICSGANTTLTATGGGTYSWNTGATSAAITVSPTNTQGYTVTATTNGCSGSAVTTVTVNTTPATPSITQNGAVLTSSSATENQWYRNGTLIPGATNQTYTVTQNGNYTVIVTSGGCSSTASAPLNFTSTGITQTDNAYFFNIYPNPSDGNFNVMFNTDAKADYRLELRNTLGQIIYSEVLTDFTGTYSRQLNVSEYGKGMYMISLTGVSTETLKKVIVY